MPYVTIIGAGSTVFSRQIMTDILQIEGLDEGCFALVDIDPGRLELAHQLAERLIAQSGKRWSVRASTERRVLLAGSDFIINSIEVAGLANVRHDFDIPMKYGINQCIGDTIGPGGIFKALRTGPAWLDILHDAEQLCPQAWVLNYTNPMSILTLVSYLGSTMRTVGLCHSVQGTSKQLAGYLNVPYEELDWRCAGTNHNAWFTRLSYLGQDMYPRLLELSQIPEIYERDPVRFEIMRYFGAFVTESSGHFSEYVPYFRKRPELIEQYCRAGYLGETGFYANNWPTWREENDANIRAMLEDTQALPFTRSHEYGSSIIEAIVMHHPTVIYGNVRNTGLIDNLQYDGCVEVACLVDQNGVQPCHFGALPEQLAALNRSHMAVHSLMSECLLSRNKEAARYALLLDPLSAAVCSPAEISDLFDEMWEAERVYLEQAFSQ